MPHNSHNSHAGHTGSSGDDLGSTDEVKIFKDEGDREDEKISSENLLEEKSSLIDLTESEEKSGKSASRQDHSPVFGKVEPHASSFNMGYLVSPYSYTNGAGGGLPVSMANKMGLSPFFCHNGDPLTTPPPAHCGIPPYQLDPKAMGLTRPAIYPFPASQYPYSMLSPDMSQVASWHTPSVYSAASSFRSPYPSSLPINTTLSSDFSFRFSPSLLPSVHTPPHHVLNSHPAIVTPGPKQEVGQDNTNHRYGRSLDQKNSPSVQADCKDNSSEKKKPHIKKPLNAFMLYMKEMRAKVVAECTLKESAAINQILGRRWHALGREEQAKYYELARRERQLHMQMYPDWSSRTNASRGKKRKRKQDTSDGGNNMKKCRARFGLDQQNQWCKPCRRKKKCIRYMEVEGEENNADLDGHVSDDNLGSCGSVDEAKTPEDDTESLNQSMSSPGCLSGLSSLQSPSTSLASPLNLLTSPSTPNTLNSSQEQQQQPHHSQQQQQQNPVFSDNSQNNSNMNNSQQLSNLDRLRKPLGSSISNNNNNNSNSSDLNTNAGPNKSAMTSTNIAVTTTATVPSSIVTSSGQIKSEKVLHNMGTSPLLSSRLGSLMGLSLNDRTSPQQRSVLDMLSSSSTSVSTANQQLLCNKSPRITMSSMSIGDNADDIARRIQSPTNLRLPQMVDDKSTIDKLISHRSHHHQQHHLIQQQQNNNSSVQSSTSSTSAFSSDIFFEKAIRNPVGANPRDVNNPLSINQLTKRDYTINNNSPPAMQTQPLQPQVSHQHQHAQSQQHQLHMMNAASPSSTISSSSTSSSSLSSSSTASNEVQTTSSITSGYLNLATTVTSSDGTNHPFNTPTLAHSSNTSQQQQSYHQQQQQQHSHQHQQPYQLIPSGASTTSGSALHHQQQQHHPNHPLGLSQHLHFAHHFPVVSATGNQSNVPTGLNSKPPTASIGTPTTSNHHRSNDSDTAAISVT